MERINFWSLIAGLFVISVLIFFLSDEHCTVCFTKEVMFLKVLIIGSMFIGATFLMSHKWAKINTLLFQIERQPLLLVAACTDEVPAQVYGKIIPDGGTIQSFSTKTDCVYCHYIKEEYRSSGDSHYWAVVENTFKHVPFKVKDESGEITVNLTNIDSDFSNFSIDKKKSLEKEDHFLVDYANSEVDCIKSVYQHSIGKGVRESEYILVPDMFVFVNGWVHKIRGQKIIAEHEHMPLIVSRKTKEAYLEDFGSKILETITPEMITDDIKKYVSNKFWSKE
jgi:hypothetical protein